MFLVGAALLASMLTLPAQPSLKGERLAMYVTAATDVLTTRAAIMNGAKEGNVVLTPLVGQKPSTIKLIGVKAASIGLTELAVKYLKKQGKYARARFLYIFSAIMWGFASAWNVQFSVK